MSSRKLILFGATIVGFISGPSILLSARAADPPIDWFAVPFVMVGSIVGILFVIGIQIFRQNPKPARFAIRTFEAISIGILAAGISSFGLSAIKYGVEPSGVFSAACGIGLFVGVALASRLFRWRYREVL